MEINNTAIKNSISNADPKKAIKLFKLFLDNINRYKDDIILLEGRLTNITDKENNRTVGFAESRISSNRINDAILRISKDLEKELNNFISFKEIKISADSFEEQLKRKLEGEYILDKDPLAEGNTSIIFKAIEKSSHQPVIIRALKNQSFKSEEEKEALEIEIDKTLKLKHRSLIKIKSFRLDDFPACYIEEFIHGVTLKKLLKLGPLPREKVFSIIIKLGKTLSYLHTKGIMHQRILPSKIFMDIEGVPVFSPFERFSNSANTSDLKKLTKELRYMSPEEVRGETSSAYSDQYRLGILMYEILTGEKLFSGNNIVEVFNARAVFHKNKRHRTEISNKLKVTTATKRVWLKMLAYIPSDRYDTILTPINLIKTKEGKINKNTPYQISFESYNRCRSKNLNFTRDFYVHLFIKNPQLINYFIKEPSKIETTIKTEEVTPAEKLAKFKKVLFELKTTKPELTKKALANLTIPDGIVFPETMLRSAITFLFSDFEKNSYLDRIINLDIHKNIPIKSFDDFLAALIETAKINDYLWNTSIETAWKETKNNCLEKIKLTKKVN